MMPHSISEVQAERAAETRKRILDAALSEFAAHGLAGARTEAIAVAAGVSKALLYYYFESRRSCTPPPSKWSLRKYATARWRCFSARPVPANGCCVGC